MSRKINLIHMVLAAIFTIAINISNAEASFHKLTVSEVEELITKELEQQGAGKNLSSNITNQRTGILFGSSVKPNVVVTNLDFNSDNKFFNADIAILIDGKTRKALTVKGNYDFIIKVPVLRTKHFRGTEINTGDIMWLDIAADKVDSGYVRNVSQLEGKIAERTISSGRPINLSSLGEPPIILRKNKVSMIYQKPYLQIRTKGIAMEDGMVGEEIRVKNETSGQIISALVMKNGTVLVE